MNSIEDIFSELKTYLATLSSADKISAINRLKYFLHTESPFHQEPVDCVIWIKRDSLETNNYNPNVMSSKEKKLLEVSLERDGFTQPIVVLPAGAHSDDKIKWQIIDGYHRYISSGHTKLNERLNGYIPISIMTFDDLKKQMASTIRHNRARGQHTVAAMSEIVCDLYQLGWDDKKIAQELGMQPDEVLRLKQISGLSALFKDSRYTEAWSVE